MGIQLTTGFRLNSKAPNFDRDQFQTLTGMKEFKEESIPEGYITYCLEDRTLYQYKGSNTLDPTTGKWRKLSLDILAEQYIIPLNVPSDINSSLKITDIEESLRSETKLYHSITQNKLYRLRHSSSNGWEVIPLQLDASTLPEQQVKFYQEWDRLPATGSDKILYIVIDRKKIYKWENNEYVELSSQVELGTTSNQAFPGDAGLNLTNKVTELSNKINANTTALALTVTRDETTGKIKLADIPELNKADLVNGKVPASQLPSYLDDVIEVDIKTALPTVGEQDKIYVVTTTNLCYRWSGTSYVEISPSLALGLTSSTAYPGNEGKIVADKVTAIETLMERVPLKDTQSKHIPKTDLPYDIQNTFHVSDRPVSNPIGAIRNNTDIKDVDRITVQDVLNRMLFQHHLPIVKSNKILVGSGVTEEQVIFGPGTTTLNLRCDIVLKRQTYNLTKVTGKLVGKTTVDLPEVTLGAPNSSGEYSCSINIESGFNTLKEDCKLILEVHEDSTQFIEYDKSEKNLTIEKELKYRYPVYYGTISNNTVNSSVVLGLENHTVPITLDVDYFINNKQNIYILVAHPESLGTLSGIIDQNDINIKECFNTNTVTLSIDNKQINYRYYILKQPTSLNNYRMTIRFK